MKNPTENKRQPDAQSGLSVTVGSAARDAAKEFCVYTRQEQSTEEKLAEIIQSVITKKDAQIDALLDAIYALKSVVDNKRHDHERIASILNGALSIGDERALDAALADGWEPDTSPATEMSNQRWYRRCPTQAAVSEEALIERYSSLPNGADEPRVRQKKDIL